MRSPEIAYSLAFSRQFYPTLTLPLETYDVHTSPKNLDFPRSQAPPGNAFIESLTQYLTGDRA
ncbi:hypothetical protein HUN01_04020 [Nostoc edaphicum CCNP1411]|uniref:Uncharacterized protein n=1 Tax=Nostoc edaphicum CCNP1411 TaxID=1472755 RepID=A0A7D7L987_9NOSO|nr:hypothetical protein [Nostoc edaphicum]QMS86778.1 hypothetical protein HUN01_04020 [Nostoc edaphicum CCNP1411]